MLGIQSLCKGGTIQLAELKTSLHKYAHTSSLAGNSYVCKYSLHRDYSVGVVQKKRTAATLRMLCVLVGKMYRGGYCCDEALRQELIMPMTAGDALVDVTV